MEFQDLDAVRASSNRKYVNPSLLNMPWHTPVIGHIPGSRLNLRPSLYELPEPSFSEGGRALYRDRLVMFRCIREDALLGRLGPI